jgi:predicted  nucleic acid-binding Zn-ribbon protein
MSAVKQLYQLQEIEQEIDALAKEIAAIEAQLSGNEALVKARNEIAGLEQQIAEIKKVQRDNEAETADVTAKITTAEKELYGGRNANPRELVNLQIEIDGLKARRSEFESKEIEIIEQLDQANTALSNAQANLARLESEWQGLRLDLTKKVEESRVHLAELNKRREQLVATIAPDAVTSYYRVKKQKGVAVAKIEQGICRGCRIQLPAREIQQARGNRIVQCSSCGRLLFMP